MSLDDAGLVLPAQRRPLTALGFLAMHDSIFVAKRPGSDQRIAQRIWLFKNRGGATGWLQKTKDDSVQLQFAEVEAPVLGDESWAAGGLIQVGGGQAITHAFRLGNTVHDGLHVRRRDSAQRSRLRWPPRRRRSRRRARARRHSANNRGRHSSKRATPGGYDREDDGIRGRVRGEDRV